MKLAIISFTKPGADLCGRLVKRMRELGLEADGYVQSRFLNALQETPGICPVKEPIARWTRQRFDHVDGLIYIGASGIAVRAIAPCLKDKMTDPAVLVIDESGKYVISLLSGHIGGANELTLMAAEILEAEPVITTATDVRKKTAIDVWAKKRNLRLSDRILAKQAAASLLEGDPVGFYSDFPLKEDMPEGFVKGEMCPLSLWITARKRPEPDHMISMFLGENARILRLIPNVLSVGIGCRKGIGAEVILEKLEQVLEQENWEKMSIRQIVSIDLKAEEEGLIETASCLQVPFRTCSARELEAVTGNVSSSAFVKRVTGTDNVCERAALCGAGADGLLVVSKQAGNGVTIAIALERIYI